MPDEISMDKTMTISEIFNLLYDLFPEKYIKRCIQSFYKGNSIKQEGQTEPAFKINGLVDVFKNAVKFGGELNDPSTKKKSLSAINRLNEYGGNERNICDYVCGYEIPRPNPSEWDLNDENRKYNWKEWVEVSKGVMDRRFAIYIYETEGLEYKMTAKEIVEDLKSRASHHKGRWNKDIIENIIAPYFYFTGELPGVENLEKFAKGEPKIMLDIVDFIKTRQKNYIFIENFRKSFFNWL